MTNCSFNVVVRAGRDERGRAGSEQVAILNFLRARNFRKVYQRGQTGMGGGSKAYFLPSLLLPMPCPRPSQNLIYCASRCNTPIRSPTLSPTLVFSFQFLVFLFNFHIIKQSITGGRWVWEGTTRQNSLTSMKRLLQAHLLQDQQHWNKALSWWALKAKKSFNKHPPFCLRKPNSAVKEQAFIPRSASLKCFQCIRRRLICSTERSNDDDDVRIRNFALSMSVTETQKQRGQNYRVYNSIASRILLLLKIYAFY